MPLTSPESSARRFTSPRPGARDPVLIDVPKDVSNAPMQWYWPDGVDLPGYRPASYADPEAIDAALALVLAAERPVIYAGGGILKAGASEALREIAELTGIPVVTTLMARGSFPDSHPLCLGMPGMHGNYAAVTAMQQADLLLALGSRFDDRVTGKVSTFAPRAKIVHVDIDKAEIGKVRRPEVGIVADCRLAIEALTKVIELRGRSIPAGSTRGSRLFANGRPSTPTPTTARSRTTPKPCHAARAGGRRSSPSTSSSV